MSEVSPLILFEMQRLTSFYGIEFNSLKMVFLIYAVVLAFLVLLAPFSEINQ